MKKIYITSLLLLIFNLTYADGIILSSNENYPGRILKSKSTNIEINVNGLIVKTITTQEFQNEWNQRIDGVYSFPLPINARVTRLMYSKGDTMIDAVLREMPQTQNPGTGQGGIVAQINEYMGQNVIRLQLSDIDPNTVKWIRLEYIMEMKHHQGLVEYSYPLDTEGFYSTPLDYLTVNINVQSEQEIINFDIPSHPDYDVIHSFPNSLNLILIEPNAYQAKDIEFNYTVSNPDLLIDLYSWDSDTTDGYFTLVGRPLLNPTENIFPANMIFLIENSSTMIGEKLNQSKQAVIQALDLLTLRDSFNVGYFNNYSTFWNSEPVVANAQNIADAKAYVEDITAGGGSNIQNALYQALMQLDEVGTTSSVLTFTDGYGYLNPYEIENYNTNKTGLFFIAFADNVQRHRLETTAQLNYGFVSYLNQNSILSSEMLKVFKKINRPLIKDVNISFSSGNVYDLYPSKFPAIYGDSDFKITGRYTTPGITTITIEGIEEPGANSYTFTADLNGPNEGNDNARTMWVKDVLNDYESQILINGETDYLKNELIDISLSEKMRCRYTAYVEDTTYSAFTDSIFSGGGNPVSLSELSDEPSSCINLFPNPVFDSFTFEVDLSEFQSANSKQLIVYDINGRIVFSYDFSYAEGYKFRKSFGKDIFDNKSGVFLFSVEIDKQAIETKTVIVAK